MTRSLGRLLAALILLGSLLPTGCASIRRRQDRAVDADIRAKAPRWQRAGRRPVRLGPYELVRVQAHEQFYDGEGFGLTINGAGREVSQMRSAATVRHAESGRERTADCKSRFVREGLEPLDGVLASQSTRVSVQCSVDGAAGGRWRLTAQALVGRDIHGRLTFDGEGFTSLQVELDLYNDLGGRRSRPVAHLRSSEGVVAGALFTYPERIWIDPALDPEATEASLALLLALRTLEYRPKKKARSDDGGGDDGDDDGGGLLDRLLSRVDG